MTYYNMKCYLTYLRKNGTFQFRPTFIFHLQISFQSHNIDTNMILYLISVLKPHQ
jgi:hypothetical protein